MVHDIVVRCPVATYSYHRVLDLWAFRSMLVDGTVSDRGFLEIESANMEQRLLPSLVTAENITDYFEEYREAQVSCCGGDINKAEGCEGCALEREAVRRNSSASRRG